MQSDGTAVLRKEHGFLFHIQSVAISVSGKILVPQGFFFSGNKGNKEIQEKTKIAKTTAEKWNLVFGKRFPVSVADFPLPGIRRYRNERSTEKSRAWNNPSLHNELIYGGKCLWRIARAM